MSIADKLITIAENTSKVYWTGAEDFGLKGTETGNPLRMDYINPTPHEMLVNTSMGGAILQKCGKNLFDPSVILKASGWEKVTDDYYYGLPQDFVNAYHWNTGTLGSMYDGFLPNTQYAFSVIGRNESKTGDSIGFYFRYSDGTNSTVAKVNSTTDTIIKFVSDPNKTVTGVHASVYNNPYVYLKNFQLEVGGANTDYEPYVEPVNYTADENGSVKGIIGKGETITLIADYGVTVECEYYKNAEKVEQDLTDIILSLGGTI